MRYIGGVLSSVEPETTSTSASGVFTLNDYAQKLSATNLPVPQLGVQILIIGGGGSGGAGSSTSARGGGGGAGGLLQSLDYSFKINRGVTYTITVGAGGSKENYTSSNGSNSEAFGAVAIGGGHGAIGYAANFAGNGGSGGGTSNTDQRAGHSIQQPVLGLTAFGNDGGNIFGRPNVSPYNARPSGGGGAGERGSTDQIYTGGDGISNTTFVKSDGSTFYGEGGVFAGGGAPGIDFNANHISLGYSVGGVGGGGDAQGDSATISNLVSAGSVLRYSIDGFANTGGGGGGSRVPNNINWNKALGPGKGGSGIVIVRYPDNFPAATVTGSPEIVNANGNRQYAFLASGTFKVD